MWKSNLSHESHRCAFVHHSCPHLIIMLPSTSSLRGSGMRDVSLFDVSQVAACLHDAFEYERPNFHAVSPCSCNMDTDDMLPFHHTRHSRDDAMSTSSDSVCHNDDIQIDDHPPLSPSCSMSYRQRRTSSCRSIGLRSHCHRSWSSRWSESEHPRVIQYHRCRIPSRRSFHFRSHCSDCLYLSPKLHILLRRLVRLRLEPLGSRRSCSMLEQWLASREFPQAWQLSRWCIRSFCRRPGLESFGQVGFVVLEL